jgi:GNAT superfamily N-acetyltransferase
MGWMSALKNPTEKRLSFRRGGRDDLPETFALAERTIHATAVELGLLSSDKLPRNRDIRLRWKHYRPLIEFMAAQPGGRYWICESPKHLAGYARVVTLGEIDQVTELMVAPDDQGGGIGRALLEHCFDDDSAPSLGRLVVATGAPRDLSLYTDFGFMPVAGHWHMRQSSDTYRARRRSTGGDSSVASVLSTQKALQAWSRLEPSVLGTFRRPLHEFLASTRTCLGLNDDKGLAVCWLGADGEIGPAVAESEQLLAQLVVAVLDWAAAIDRVESLSVFCTSAASTLIGRLRKLGFGVYWPSWIMSSMPLRRLDTYLPTRPPHLL